MSNVVDFTAARLDRSSVIYTVEIEHRAGEMACTVRDVQDDPRSRLAVAADLEAAARMLRDGLSGEGAPSVEETTAYEGELPSWPLGYDSGAD